MSSFGSSDDGMTTATRFELAGSETELYCPACDQSFTEDVQHCPRDGTRLVRLSDVRDPLIGRNLEGRFLIKERLGVGGMGAVYRAWQGSVGREVAVKVIEARLKGGRLAAKRFLREAKLASRLSHPSTVSVIDFGQTEDGLLYLVMELVKGRTMGDVLLEDGPFPVDRMIRVGLQLCDALEAAHKLSIIHRDLKPSNIIMLDEPVGRDLVKVLDFGLAKSLIDEGSTTVTQSDAIMGTPSYIPPEAVTRMVFDERSDLYSLGVILYEVLVGRLPFEAATVQAMLRQHAYERPAPLPESVPRPVVDLLLSLLEKEPDRRPPTAAVVREILLSLTGIPERGTPLPISRQHVFSSQPVSGAGMATPTPGMASGHAVSGRFDNHTMSLPRRGRPWLVVGFAGMALSLSAVLIASGVFDRGDGQAPAPIQTAPAAAPAPPPVASGSPSTDTGAGAATERPGGEAAPTTATATTATATATTTATAAAATTTTTGEASAAAAMVTLEFTSDPAPASVYLGGSKIGVTPLRHQVPRGDEEIVVEFRKVGHREEKVSVVPDRDRPVAATLERKAVARPSRPSRPATRPARPAPPPEKTGPSKPPPVFLPRK